MALSSKQEESKKTETSGSSADLKMPQILLQPRISEKAGRLAALNKYVFNVLKKANKVEIKKAVERMYKVKVVAVNVVNNQGKTKTSGRLTGRTSDFKKAVVTLKQGDKIEGVTETV